MHGVLAGLLLLLLSNAELTSSRSSSMTTSFSKRPTFQR